MSTEPMSEEAQAEKTQREKRIDQLITGMYEVSNQSPLEQYKWLASWMAGVEADNRERDKKLRRVHEFKEEIKVYVQRVQEIESRISTQINGIGEAANAAINEIAQHVQLVHRGLNQLEGRIHAMWNTTNTAIHFLVEVLSGGYSFPYRWAESDGVSTMQFTQAKEKVQQMLIEAGRKLFNEAQQHQKAEFDRIRKEQREGKEPSPMKPHEGSFATKLVGDHVDMLRQNSETAKKMQEEINAGRKTED